VSPAPYLVFFSRDPVDDMLADAIARTVRSLAGARAWGCPVPGWFDDPDASPEDRTCGGYVRVDDLAGDDAAALLSGAQRLSAELEIVVEVQWRERPLGEIAAGAPRGALAALLDERPAG
jgi:hypothetical protein